MKVSEKKIVVNGTFDLLHRGHIELLKYAKGLGDFLLVLIDSDARVKQLKGNERPINNQNDRKFFLENIKCVDQVWIFDDEDELEELLELYKPDVMVKGSDYKNQRIVGSHLCKEILFYDRTEHSTTKTIQYITNRGHVP
jgi:D-beta-D-heptose 7-phosphate kinase/D-beta-D-heptose 1-phosphate adenosyltransferase